MIDPVSGSPAWTPLRDAPDSLPSVSDRQDAEQEPHLPDLPLLGAPGLPLSVSEAVARYTGAGAIRARPADADTGTDIYA